MMRRSTPSLLFAALTVLLFWRVLFLGETLIATDLLAASPIWRETPGEIRNPHLSDTVEYYYPSEKLYSESVRRGELPASNPYLFGGTPVPHGVHIWNSIWPVKLAFLLLFDPVRSYDFFAIFHFWLAAVAFHSLARGLGCGPFAAFAAALAYVLSGRSMVWLHGHYLMATMAYAPAAFLLSRGGSLLGAIPLAGLCYTNPHAGIAVVAAVLLFDRRAWRPALVAVALSAAVWVPLSAIVQESLRGPADEARHFYRDGWRCWLMLAGLAWPGAFGGSMPANEYNIYLGLVPLAGALLGLRRERYFAILAGAALAAATLWPLPVLLAPLSFSLPTRWLFLFTLGGCVCFARALDRVPPRAWMRGAIVLLILADLVPRFLAWNGAYDPAILRERPAAVEALKGRTGWILPAHPALGRPVIPPLSIFGVESIQGYDVSVPREQAAALAGAAEVSGGRVIYLKDPEHPALDGAGMRFLVTGKPLLSTRHRLVHSGRVFVYENPAARESPARPGPSGRVRLGLALTLAAALGALAWGIGSRKRGTESGREAERYLGR